MKLYILVVRAIEWDINASSGSLVMDFLTRDSERKNLLEVVIKCVQPWLVILRNGGKEK